MKQVFYQFPEMKNDLIVVYNEIQEAIDNIQGGDLWKAVCRLEKAQYWLEKYVSKNDKLKEDIK